MEKHLGWMLGVVGTLLLGAMSPILLQKSGPESPSLMQHLSTSPSALTGMVLTIDGSANAVPPLDFPDKDFTNHIRHAGVIAKQSVGGGRIVQLSSQPLSGQDVWQVEISKPQKKWIVTISRNDYTVLAQTQIA